MIHETIPPREVDLGPWNDVWATDILPANAAAAPDRAAIPGLTGLDCYGYDGNATTESETGSIEIPHDYKEGSDLWPHIHWCGSDGTAGDVKWQFEYSIGKSGEEFTAPVTIALVAANPGLGANGRAKMRSSEFPKINGTGRGIGDIIRFRLFRDPTDPADTYANKDAIRLQVGIHYQLDTLGSRQRFNK